MEFKNYRKTGVVEMAPWTPDVDMDRVSVSASDKENGSPKEGDMIARNVDNHDDQWLVAEDFFNKNYEEVS